MTLAQFSAGALVLVPLLAAAVMALLNHLTRRILGVVIAITVAALTVPVILHVGSGDVLEVPLGEYGAPLGIMLRADGLSVLFVTMTSIVGLCVTAFAAVTPEATGDRIQSNGQSKTQHPGFWPLWFGCWAGLNAVFVSGDLFNTYVGLELVGLTAVGLVALGGQKSWPAALRYLFIAVLGSLLFLVAVGLLVSVTGTLDINQVAAQLADNPEASGVAVVAMALLSIGLAMKVALVPMHHWLVPAHSGAPSAVSPILSALVIKGALFVFLRCWIYIAAPAYSPALADAPEDAPFSIVGALNVIAWVFALLGLIALIVGAVLALRQTRLKPLIAYSTVAQAGHWFLLLPVVFMPASDSLGDPGVTSFDPTDVVAGVLAGTVGLIIGHGLAKSALFLTAGYFKELYGTEKIAALSGAARSHPLMVMTMGLTAIGLAGLPFSLSFTGKWQLTSASLAAGHYWMLPVVVVATLLSAAYLLHAFGPLMMDNDEEAATQPAPRRGSMPVIAQAAPFTLGVLTVLTGFMGAPIFELLDVGAPWN